MTGNEVLGLQAFIFILLGIILAWLADKFRLEDYDRETQG